MGIKKYKPTTDALRWTVLSDFEEITKSRPEKKLLLPLRKSGGRNARGRITSRHRGGGVKRMIRIIDFKRDKLDVPAKVIAIEYDPNRSARLALLEYADGEKRYIIAPAGLSVNDEVTAGPQAEIKVGNAAPIQNIPAGIPIHNVEFKKGSGARIYLLSPSLYSNNASLADLLGSYSMAITFAGMSGLSRLKSIILICLLWPPPRCLEVILP